MESETTPLVQVPAEGDSVQSSLHSSVHFEDDESGSRSHYSRRGAHRRNRSLSETISESIHEVGEAIAETVTDSLAEVKEVFTETVHHVEETFEHVVDEVKEVIAEEIAEPVKPREEGEHSEKLSALALAVLVFYKVSGGPFGCEPAVKAGGPFFAILGFIVFPLIWCIPEALVTAELGAAYPEPSGAVAWVEEAFGPKAGLLSGYFHWVSGATDNAIYPSLFLEYIAQYSSANLRGDLVRFVFTAIVSVVLAGVNYTGLEIVGNVSMVVCAISLSPFIFLCILGIPNIEPSRWFVMPKEGVVLDDDDVTPYSGWFPDFMWLGVMWRPLINILFWNLNSFDVGASFAGEVQDPARVFPRAMFLSVILVVMSYILPLVIAIGATDSEQEDWNAGYFTTAAVSIAGPWLGGWMVFAAAVSNIALFEAEMSGDAYQLMGMADRGLIPKLFSKRSRFDTPTNGILLGALVIIAMGIANFEELVEMLNFAYSISMLMEFSAFVKLRITAADVDRPYKVPFGTFGCVLFVTPPSLLCIFMMLVASYKTYVYFVILLAFGFLFGWLQKFAKHYGWIDYAQPPPRARRSTAPQP